MWFHRILRWTFGEWLRRAYGLVGEGLDAFEGLRAPYVLVGNHVSTRDVFFLSILVREPIWWVATDAHLRRSVMRAILGLVGTIPKAKAIPDFVTVDTIVKVIRKKRGVVGFFPEGQQSWDGRTLPVFHSTAKLFKLLKVPVILAKTKGGFASLPRWSWKRRKGGVTVEFKRLLGPDDLARMESAEIETTLVEALRHDELEWLGANGTKYGSRKRAERLELALFMCPNCSSIGGMRSKGTALFCEACGSSQRLDGSYRFRRDGATEPRFGDLREWMSWQAAAIGALAFEAVARKSATPLFSDEGVSLFRGSRMSPLVPIARGRLDLYHDRMELVVRGQTHLQFHIRDLEGIGVLTRQIFEYYVGRNLYRITFPERHVSALKWQLALEALIREAS